MEDPEKREQEQERLRLEVEAASLRKKQAKKVMPLIGPLLDEFDMLPGDVRSDLEQRGPEFVAAVNKILKAMEIA